MNMIGSQRPAHFNTFYQKLYRDSAPRNKGLDNVMDKNLKFSNESLRLIDFCEFLDERLLVEDISTVC